MMGWYGGGGMGSLGFLGTGVLWLALILLVIWLVVRLLPGSGTTRNTGESALEILDRRLANGRIDFEPWPAPQAAIRTAGGEQEGAPSNATVQSAAWPRPRSPAAPLRQSGVGA